MMDHHFPNGPSPLFLWPRHWPHRRGQAQGVHVALTTSLPGGRPLTIAFIGDLLGGWERWKYLAEGRKAEGFWRWWMVNGYSDISNIYIYDFMRWIVVETSFFWLNQPKLDEQEDLTGFNTPKNPFSPLVSWFVGGVTAFLVYDK